MATSILNRFDKMCFLIVISTLILYSCNNDSSNFKQNNKESRKNFCPIDSISYYIEDNKKISLIFINNFALKLAEDERIDTSELKRYLIKGRILIEAIEIINGRIADTEWAMYADVKDTLEGFMLIFHNNESLGFSEGMFTNKILGYEFVSENGMDTLKSITNYILVPKEKFNGIIKFEEISNITHKGKKRDVRQPIYIDTEMMKKYGNILGQYKAIMENCDLSIPQQAKEK